MASSNGNHITTPPPIDECSFMCDSELEILGIPPSKPDIKQVPGVLLLCGHMACKTCYQSWEKTNQRDQKFPTCIVCRHEMMYQADFCSHNVPATLIPGKISDGKTLVLILSRVPKTVPEGGNRTPYCCKKCEYEDRLDRSYYLSCLAYR
ncbi:hypothetical protein QBC38DRAFT_461416 [Podospora fimiseda]|uniref:RING-type domain-containing protein n=1 Tax=Podospora fimiseda TaxID=252190 RepID=A0AAN6YLU5_9PEZI|nr:hypothetical protein QBC38DRAFT_461416 [Podospora fimiseda]